MRFLCLVYQVEEKLAALSQHEMDSLVGACMRWTEDLEKAGHHVLSAGLQSVRSAATVRIRDGSAQVTDGPFAETKEFLGGFTLIDARDLDEALRLPRNSRRRRSVPWRCGRSWNPRNRPPIRSTRKSRRLSFGTSRDLTRLCPRKKWCRSPNPIGRRNNEIPMHGLLRAEGTRQSFQARV